MGTVHIPTLLEGILEATAAEAAAKARITTIRAALEAEGRRRLAEEGAAPSWHTPQLGKVRLEPAGDWTATVADPAAFGSYAAEHHPTEATLVVELAAADAEDALKALEFIGVTPAGTRVEVRPAFLGPFLKSLAVDVDEQRDASAQIIRTVTAADTTTGNVIPGIGCTRSEAKLVVSLDRDRRTAAVEEARTTASALVEAATDDAEAAAVDHAALDVRRVELEGLRVEQLATIAKGHGLGGSGTKAALAERIARAEQATGLIVRPASTIDTPAINHRRPYVGEGADGARRSAEIDRTEAEGYDAADPRVAERLASAAAWEAQAHAAPVLPDGTEVEEVSTVPLDQPVEEVPDAGTVEDAEEAADLAALVAEVNAAPEVTLDSVPNLDHDAEVDRLDKAHSREALRKFAKHLGLSAAGTKAEVMARLVDAGHTATTITTP